MALSSKVRVGVADSGINPHHRHVGGVGVSLAVAHVTGMAAALLAESAPKSELADRLARG